MPTLSDSLNVCSLLSPAFIEQPKYKTPVFHSLLIIILFLLFSVRRTHIAHFSAANLAVLTWCRNWFSTELTCLLAASSSVYVFFCHSILSPPSARATIIYCSFVSILKTFSLLLVSQRRHTHIFVHGLVAIILLNPYVWIWLRIRWHFGFFFFDFYSSIYVL